MDRCDNYTNTMFTVLLTYDLSIGSTETKYIKLNIFCHLNENLTTFLYTLTGGDKKTEREKKVFSSKKYTKVECC